MAELKEIEEGKKIQFTCNCGLKHLITINDIGEIEIETDEKKNDFDETGFDKNGYDKDGYDKLGYNKKGRNRKGIRKSILFT